ncbi:MAG: zinc-dependent metalloprotease [Hyphomicrobium sp.]|nr:zinc-dependent metalloprotease [Hyphomicrobium sp.]
MRWFVLLSLRALLLAGALNVYESAGADERLEVVLVHLPTHGSAEYQVLKDVSGAQVAAELPMTRGEAWQIPKDRLDALKKAAAVKGVSVTPLDQTWNHAFTPMPTDYAMTAGQKSMMTNAMQQAPVMGMTTMTLPSPAVLENALTKDMNRNKVEGNARLVLKLDHYVSVTAERTSIREMRDGYAWHGAVEGTDEPVTLMWWADGRLTGNITYQGQIYSIRNLGDGLYGILKLAPKMLPPEHAPMSDRQMRDMGMKKDPLVQQGDASTLHKGSVKFHNQQDSSEGQRFAAIRPGVISGGHFSDPATRPEIVISVLVAFTKSAARFYSDIGRDLIELAIEDANLSFNNSGLSNVRLELVHAYETDYTEAGSHFEHVFAFADLKDGAMDEVHELRDHYRADVAILIVDDPKGCGLAAQIHASPDRAFAVVDQGCTATSYSLAHEIGHLIGARHDVSLDDNDRPFSYGHGFVHGTEWRTLMGYKESCGGCPRLPIWSSPTIKIRGMPAGNVTSNNARVIAEEAARVAAFR